MRFLVTGGSRGIGAQIVRDVCAAGHDVAFTYRTNAEQAQEVVAAVRALRPDAVCHAYQLDVRDPGATEIVVDSVIDVLGGLEVVVPNAGINLGGLLVSISDEEWAEMIDTNLSGAFYLCRQALPALIAARFGRIVFVSSVGKDGGMGQAAYGATKAGIGGLSQAISKEYGRKG